MVSLAKPHLKWGRLRWSYSCPYICNVLYEFCTYFHMFLCSLNMYASVYVYWYCIVFYIAIEWRTGHLKTSSNLRKGGSSLALNLSSHTGAPSCPSPRAENNPGVAKSPARFVENPWASNISCLLGSGPHGWTYQQIYHICQIFQYLQNTYIKTSFQCNDT